MLEYFLNLMNNQSTRLYLFFMTLACFVNVLMFEIFHAIIFSKLLLICFFVLSSIFFFVNTLIVNIKEQYISNCLCLENVNQLLAKLSSIEYHHIMYWEPNILHRVIIESNYSIDNLLSMIENVTQIFFKITINAFIILLFKRNLTMLMVLTLLIVIMNIFWLLNNQHQKSFIKMDKLYNYSFYLLHHRLKYLYDMIHHQFHRMIKHIHIKSYTSFVYINFLLVSLYLYIGFDHLNLNDKLYIIIYARNSSYIFTLIQSIIMHYDNIRNNWNSIRKIIELPNKKIIPQISFDDKYQIHIEQLEFTNQSENSVQKITLASELFLSHHDKVIVYGDSGVGKTTLFHVFKGLVRPLQSKIWYNDDLVEFNFSSIENNILLVKNDMFKYFNEKLEEFVFEDYTQNYELFDYLVGIMKVKELQQNSKTNNLNISSGETRRITLLKVFYQFYMGKYAILLLDEMDNGIHQSLFLAILTQLFHSEYFKDKMILVISHNRTLHQSNLFNTKLHIKNGHIFVNQKN